MRIISIFSLISTKAVFTKKTAVVSVINDLVTDSRVQKTCRVLMEAGYEVKLIGRELPGSLPLPQWPWQSVRMKLLFTKGPAFYFFFNLRLFFRLLFTKADLLFSNDLDTLWPSYSVSKLKKIPLIYDSHELFCEVPELQQTPTKKKIWENLEGRIVPELKYCITVNESIAKIFEAKYKVKFHVIRNIPEQMKDFTPLPKKELNLPEEKKIILLQGAGINIQRGAEELIDAMEHVENTLLLIIGGGDVWPVLEEKVKQKKLQDKIRLMKKIPKRELMSYTFNADLGISIDKDTNPNYRYSLPNKLFDYLQAGVPVLASRLPEIEKIINAYEAGWFIDSHEPGHIAERIRGALASPDLVRFRQNAQKAAADLSWEKERQKYLEIIRTVKS
jgi:glycosyltransferase involved in cell wall biosynthesis